jgi:hypothetical protein
MARLPQPGGDSGQWGDVLNDFLSQAHSSNGALKPNSVGGAQIQDGAVSNIHLASDAITATKLHPDVRDQLNAVSAGGATNLSATATGTSLTVASDTGTDAVLSAASSTTAGVMSAADKAKLDTVSTGATTNMADSALLNRANHTGTQAISTVTNLQTTLNGKVAGQNGATGLWIGTQAEYNAIASKSATTLYVVTDA